MADDLKGSDTQADCSFIVQNNKENNTDEDSDSKILLLTKAQLVRCVSEVEEEDDVMKIRSLSVSEAEK